MRVLVLHNPKAGGGGHSKGDLLDALRRKGFLPSYCSTKDEGFAEALCEPTELVVAAGGDGTVRKVLTELPDRSVPVTVLPLGTANNIARSLHIAGTVEGLAARWAGAANVPFDIGMARDASGRHLFVESIGIGAIADAIALADATPAEMENGLDHGRDALRAVVRNAKSLPFTLAAHGEATSGNCLLLEVMNTPLIGPNLRLAPPADTGDGLLDVVWIPSEAREALLEWIDAPRKCILPAVARRVRKAAITWGEGQLHVDDDVIGDVNSGDLAIEHEPKKSVV